MAEAHRKSQLSLGPLEVNRLEGEGETVSPQSGPRPELPEIPLTMAKMQMGAALRRTLKATGTALKEVGDPSQVIRVCDGDIPSVLARVWAHPERRRQWIKEQARESGLFDEQVSLHERKRG